MKCSVLIFTLITTFIITSVCNAKSYDQYTLFRGIPTENEHLNFYRGISKYYDVNYWREPGLLNMPVEFVIAPEDKPRFLEEASIYKLKLTTLMENVQSAFDNQTIKPYTRSKTATFNWHDYYRTEDIYAWLRDLARMFPKEMHIEEIGKTKEGRQILAVKVILKGSARRSKVIIEGGIHAREWISPAFVTYMIHEIVYSSQSKNTMLKSLGKTYEFYFVPILNPDGYDYTHTKDRLWRKNCNGRGVDLNRNFGHGFGLEGASTVSISETFQGTGPFSELETAAMKKFVDANSNNLEYYLSFHSYGQYIIIPYTNLKQHVENYNEVYKMGKMAASVIESVHKSKFSIGTAYDTVGYLVGGSSCCWVKSTHRVPYVMTFELRDKGNFGFALPAGHIIPACQETMAGVSSLLIPQSNNFQKLKYDYISYDNHSYRLRMSLLDKTIIVLNLLIIMSVL